jgi:hypothetical protein
MSINVVLQVGEHDSITGTSDTWGINKFFTSITGKLYSTKIMQKYDND